ncbi:hypothetical protein llap_3151 [Limosa lapponica baueri]|uniref:Uncharacterized protein n=1 Tax=Limosa lapponica baueri TaxID=1758121 RepID=A0A2I0UKE8_LIMLA|nr:hypothetical protein llap_3151 [Limosa lapponica baueri]
MGRGFRGVPGSVSARKDGGSWLSRSQECTLAAMKANGIPGCIKRSTDNGLLGSDWEVIISLYLALVCLDVEYDAQFGGFQ